jgi:hypothetical protein
MVTAPVGDQGAAQLWTGVTRMTTVGFELARGTSRVTVAGALDYAAVPPCRAPLDVATDGRAPIVFDMDQVAPPGAVSVALLGAMRRYVSVRGAVMTLAGVPRPWRSALEQANVWNLYELARDGEQTGDRRTPSKLPTTWIGGQTLVVRPLRTVHGRPGGTGPDPSRGPPARGPGTGDTGGDRAG